MTEKSVSSTDYPKLVGSLKGADWIPTGHPEWSTFRGETTVVSNSLYLRKIGTNIVYYQTEANWRCLVCDDTIKSTPVAHSIHDGPFEMSGSGRVHYEDVPYCNNCEEKPSYHGFPITAGK